MHFSRSCPIFQASQTTVKNGQLLFKPCSLLFPPIAVRRTAASLALSALDPGEIVATKLSWLTGAAHRWPFAVGIDSTRGCQRWPSRPCGRGGRRRPRRSARRTSGAGTSSTSRGEVAGPPRRSSATRGRGGVRRHRRGGDGIRAPR